MIEIILVAVGLIGLLIGSFTDIKKREVPDWLNYFLIASGIGLRLVNSMITSDWYYLLYGLIGAGVFFGFANLMFYAGQWGGGDSKLLVGMGAIFATYPAFLLSYFNPVFFSFSNQTSFLSDKPYLFLVVFLINLFLIGAFYGLIYSIILAFKSRKKFFKEFKKLLSDKKNVKIKRIVFIFSFISLIISLGFLNNLFVFLLMLLLILVIILMFYMFIFTKAVEMACMLKYVVPEKLTEGDWIAKEVKVNGKLITGPKDLGISKKQIRELINLKKKGKINKILIKEGIPFVPSFLLAAIISLVWGNIIFLLI